MNKVIKVTEDTIYVGKSEGEIVKTDISNASWDVNVGDEVEIFANDEIIILYLLKKFEQKLNEDEKQKLRQELETEIRQEIKQKFKTEYMQKLRQELETEVKQEIRQEIEEDVKQQLRNELELEVKQELNQSTETPIQYAQSNSQTDSNVNSDNKIEQMVTQIDQIMANPSTQYVSQSNTYQTKQKYNSFSSKLVKKCKPKLIAVLSIFLAIFLSALIAISVMPKGKKYTGEFDLYGKTIKLTMSFKKDIVDMTFDSDDVVKNNNSNSDTSKDEVIGEVKSDEEIMEEYYNEIIREMLGTTSVKYKIKDGYLYTYDSLTKGYSKDGKISSTKIEMEGLDEDETIILTDKTFSKIKTISIIGTVIFGILDLFCLVVLYLGQNGILKSEE